MFDDYEFVDRLEVLRKKMIISKAQLAEALGMHLNTLLRICSKKNVRPLSYKTMRSIKEFIETHEKEL